MAAGDPVLYSLYIYKPNKAAAVVFTIVYAIPTAFHLWQCHSYKAWRLMGLHVACGLLFVAGYALRVYGAHDKYVYDPNDLAPLLTFLLSQVFIYTCPPLLELCNYHILGRLFYYVPFSAPLPAGRVLAVFGGIMLIIEGLNGVGVSLAVNSSSSPSTQALGGHFIVTVVAIQLIVILIFIGLAGIFHWRFKSATPQAKKAKTIIWTLYSSMALIFIRCIYRLVEHTGNTKKDLDSVEAMRQLSPILRYEWYFYVFDALFMSLNSLLWAIWNPARILPRDYRFHLAPDGTLVEGREVTDTRTWKAKVAHIATFGILYGKKRSQGDFNELVSLSDRNE